MNIDPEHPVLDNDLAMGYLDESANSLIAAIEEAWLIDACNFNPEGRSEEQDEAFTAVLMGVQDLEEHLEHVLYSRYGLEALIRVEVRTH